MANAPYGTGPSDRIVAETLERERVAALRALPTYVWAGGSDSGETCVLCIEPFHNGASLRKLPCNHLYHKECIDKWLIYSMVSVLRPLFRCSSDGRPAPTRQMRSSRST